MVKFDRIIIGGGLYGLYAAIKSAELGLSVLVLEQEKDMFQRASYVNQARVHNGLHYPRSIETAKQCNKYYNRFLTDHHKCINKSFNSIYAISAKDSLVDASRFENLINILDLDYVKIPTSRLFKKGSIEEAFNVQEATFDYIKMKMHYLDLAKNFDSLIKILCGYRVCEIQYIDGRYIINGSFSSEYLLNTTYASTNQVASMLSEDLIDTKHELCEVVLCNASSVYNNIGITVMDGGFFSLMPWGHSCLHTLTSVHHTPHCQYIGALPIFDCMTDAGFCSKMHLGDCNKCIYTPQTAFNYMMSIVDKFLIDSRSIKYTKSLYAVKTILREAEIDDNRPTIIKTYSNFPGFYSVLSGKISTIYELDTII